jgi:RND family efflux transporter MFP subunit
MMSRRNRNDPAGSVVDLLGSTESTEPVIELQADEVTVADAASNGTTSANGNGSAPANGNGNGSAPGNGHAPANGNGHAPANGTGSTEPEPVVAGARSDAAPQDATQQTGTQPVGSPPPAASIKPVEWVEPPVPAGHVASTAASVTADADTHAETDSEPGTEQTEAAVDDDTATDERADADGEPGDVTEPVADDHEGAAIEGLDASPPERGPFRTGFDEVGTGLVDLGRATLGPVRRVAPIRVKRLTDRRLGLALVLTVVVILAVLALVITAVSGLLAGPTSVVVVAARSAVITTAPGGVGSLSAAPQHVSTISLNVVGVTSPISVTSVDVVAGQQVTKGQPLLQLNPVPFEQNEAQIAATLTQSQQALASATSAAAGGAGSSSGYLAVQIPTLAGEVALNQQLLAIATGNASAITSPIAGYVSNLRITPGQVVTPGNTLLQVIDPSQVVVSSGMQLSDLQSIATGDSATITPTQLPGVHLTGKVIAVSALAPSGGLQGTVVVSAANIPGHPVPIGTQTFVSIRSSVHATVSVPSVAVLNAELNPVVATVKDNKVTFQPVQVGASNGTRTQILSGLRRGQRVAITNLQDLSNGSQVSVSSGGT